MKTAVELYEAFLTELDRYSSPNAQVVDFLHFWNAATYSFIESELSQFEVTNVVSDRLRMISHGATIPLNSDSCDTPKKSWIIPLDYFRLFGVKAVFKLAKNHGFSQKKGDEFVRALRKLTADMDNFILENRFYKPSSKNPFYQVLDNTIQFVYEDELKPETHIYIKNFTIRYVKQPTLLQLSDDFQSFNSSSFPIDVNYLILKIAVLMFMGTTEDTRIQLKSKI